MTAEKKIFPTFEQCYQFNKEKIRTKIKRGRILDLYNCEIKGKLNKIKKALEVIYREQKDPIKINFSFGYILRSIVQEQYVFFHPSNNNAYLNQPKLIINDGDKQELLKLVVADDINEFVYKSKFKSSWVVHSIVSVAFRITKL